MLTQERIAVLAEPLAGGHRIGAPATHDEVRDMARELLLLASLGARRRYDMALVVDEAVQGEARIEAGDCSVEAIERIFSEHERRVERADALIDDVGAREMVEALRRRGVLHDDRFDEAACAEWLTAIPV